MEPFGLGSIFNESWTLMEGFAKVLCGHAWPYKSGGDDIHSWL